jgi:hypothetical protein
MDFSKIKKVPKMQEMETETSKQTIVGDPWPFFTGETTVEQLELDFGDDLPTVGSLRRGVYGDEIYLGTEDGWQIAMRPDIARAILLDAMLYMAYDEEYALKVIERAGW